MEKHSTLDPELTENAPTAASISLPEGSSRVKLRIEAPPEAQLEIGLEVYSPGGQLLERKDVLLGGKTGVHFYRSQASSRVSALARAIAGASAQTLAGWLLWASLGIYLFTRLVGLASFPIYFFTDEAVQTVLAADLLRDSWVSSHELLPTFFQNGSQYNLGLSVYLQVIPYFFFGKSIWVTRGTAALVTFLAAVSAGLTLKKIFKISNAWLGVIFLSLTPAWFLHSRTAFETSLAVTFFAVFLYYYLCYRQGEPRRLYGAVIAAAAAFYSYSPARIVILVAGLLLFLVDIRYHWQQRAHVLRAFGLALMLALPFARFLVNHPDASAWQMRLLGSIWVTDASIWVKLKSTLGEYLHGLDPLYWYLPHTLDLPRHTMLGYGHLLRPALPLGLLGIGLAVKNFRQPAWRTLLVAVAAAPAGAALVRLGITRALFMVVPIALLTALAMDTVLGWLHYRTHIPVKALSAGAFFLLAAGNLFMFADALTKGPLWSRNYSLAGMQYGARQVFGEIKQMLEKQPDYHILLSPSWANGTDVIARFFFPDPLPFELGSAQGYYSVAKPLEENQLFVMIPEEFDSLPLNHFKEVKVEKTLPYPDGQPGFYFVRLQYADDIQEIIARELAERHELDHAQTWWGADLVKVGFTKLDMGSIDQLYDGDPTTLVRTWAVNPMQLIFDFPFPRELRQVDLQVGGTATGIEIRVKYEGQSDVLFLPQYLAEAPLPRIASFHLPQGGKVEQIAITIQNVNDPADGHVHLWEVSFH